MFTIQKRKINLIFCNLFNNFKRENIIFNPTVCLKRVKQFFYESKRTLTYAPKYIALIKTVFVRLTATQDKSGRKTAFFGVCQCLKVLRIGSSNRGQLCRNLGFTFWSWLPLLVNKIRLLHTIFTHVRCKPTIVS